MKVLCGVDERGKRHGVVLGDLGVEGPDRSVMTHEKYVGDWLPGAAGIYSKGFSELLFRCRRHGSVIVHIPEDERAGAYLAHKVGTECSERYTRM